MQKTNRDALLAAREDIILGVGDEFCLAAGTMLPDKKISGNENTSVMRATPDGVTLSVGKDLTETGEGIGKGDWYKPQGIWGKEEWLAMTSLVAGVLGGVSTAVAISGQADKELPDWTMGFYAGNLLTLLSLGASAWLGAEVLADVKIEPVRHVDPAQKIWLHRDGTIGIVSTKGEDGARAVDGSKGRIVMGVNKQEADKQQAEGWKYYDDYLDFEDKDTKWYAGRIRKITLDKVMKKVRRKSLKESAKHKKLGLGSNIIIEKDKIWLRSGEPGKESLQIVQDNKSDKRIGLYTYNPDKRAEWARIAIFQADGQISLDNKKRNGIISLESKKQIQLITTGADIHIDAGSKYIRLKSDGKFKKIFSRNLEAL
ncbi:MAG: hypothetical protein JSV55_12965 [Deltaproteobacteria bacterium]|nr:MAG: hypothetical protein JSV55_12965 [Deltaproteobacteria bacterium]